MFTFNVVRLTQPKNPKQSKVKIKLNKNMNTENYLFVYLLYLKPFTCHN